LATSSIRVLVVDDSEAFRRFVCSTVQGIPDMQIISEVSDGLEAVRKAEELQPDLITLDIGLPNLNGIEAARQIRKLSPESKILFISQESSIDVVFETLSLGARGYVMKSDPGTELVTAVKAVLRDERFVSRRFGSSDSTALSGQQVSEQGQRIGEFIVGKQQGKEFARHEALFYSDDESFVDHVAPFIGAALREGAAGIVIATESHRDTLLATLQASGVKVGTAIVEGRYLALDAAETLSACMVNGVVDSVRFQKTLSNLIVAAAQAAKKHHLPVTIFGECVQLLWAQGRLDAAIELEKLGNELVKTYSVDILCGYALSSFQGGIGSHIFEKICAEHSAVHSGSFEQAKAEMEFALGKHIESLLERSRSMLKQQAA
jgi:DNA-binding NarL/FixJ family response regulator